jgi:hypothetical protein
LIPTLVVVPLACAAERVTVWAMESVELSVEDVTAVLVLVLLPLAPTSLAEDTELVATPVYRRKCKPMILALRILSSRLSWSM